MKIYHGDEVVGVIRLTGPVRQNIVAGDIVSGKVRAGDEVIWEKKPDSKQDAAGEPEK
jgi:hypothetical protein